MQTDWMEGFEAVCFEDWQKALDKTLKQEGAFWNLTTTTLDGIKIDPLYLAGNHQTLSVPTLKTGTGFRQRIDDPDAARAKRALSEDLNGGVSAFTLVSKTATSAMACGLPPFDSKAMAALFSGIELDRVDLALDGGTDSFRLMSDLLLLYHNQKIPASRTHFHPCLSPTNHLAMTGALPEEVTQKTISERFSALVSEGYKGHFFAADARLYHSAGASEVQELALLLAEFKSRLEEAEALSLSLEEVARSTILLITSDTDLWLSVAKLRAARQLIHYFLEAAGLSGIDFKLEAEVAPRLFSAFETMNNLLRSILATTAGLFGGAAAIRLGAPTLAIGTPDLDARRLTRHIGLIAKREAGLAWVTDPLAGAGAVESLTATLAERAWHEFQKIEREGGLKTRIVSGKLAEEIGEKRAARRQQIACRQMPLTGISMFPDLGDDHKMIEPGTAINLLCDDKKASFSRYPLSADFDRLRARPEQSDHRGSVFLAPLGSAAEVGGRANFATNLFAAGGMTSNLPPNASSVAEVVSAFQASPSPLICLVGSDKLLESQGEAMAKALREAGAGEVWSVGLPEDALAIKLAKAGVTSFIDEGQGDDKVALLTRAQQVLGLSSPTKGGPS